MNSACKSEAHILHVFKTGSLRTARKAAKLGPMQDATPICVAVSLLQGLTLSTARVTQA